MTCIDTTRMTIKDLYEAYQDYVGYNEDPPSELRITHECLYQLMNLLGPKYSAHFDNEKKKGTIRFNGIPIKEDDSVDEFMFT